MLLTYTIINNVEKDVDIMSVSEKVAYLRGLMEGLDMDEDSKEGKLFAAIVDALDEMASEICDMEEDIEDIDDSLDELEEYIEEVDEALGDVEEFVYDCDCDDDCDCCCDDDCDCCDDDCIEAVCPACNAEICIDFDDIDDEGKVECPACGEILEFEIEEEEAEDEE